MKFNEALKEVGKRMKETDSSRGAILFKNATFHFYEENAFKIDVLFGGFNDKMNIDSKEFFKEFPNMIGDNWEENEEEVVVYKDKLFIYGLDEKGNDFFKPYTYKDMSDIELDF